MHIPLQPTFTISVARSWGKDESMAMNAILQPASGTAQPSPEVYAAASEMLVAINGILGGFAKRDVGVRLFEAPDGTYGAILQSAGGDPILVFSPPLPVNDI